MVSLNQKPGQSLVEAALIIPVCLLLIIGTADLFGAYRARLHMQDALAQVVHYVIQHPRDDDGAQAVFRQHVVNAPQQVQQPSLTLDRHDCSPGQEHTTVRIQYGYTWVFGLFGGDATWGETSRIPQMGGC